MHRGRGRIQLFRNGSFHIKLMKGTENGILRREISGAHRGI